MSSELSAEKNVPKIKYRDVKKTFEQNLISVFNKTYQESFNFVMEFVKASSNF